MLTGKTRYRMSWRRKMILQVQYSYVTNIGFLIGTSLTAWRDATFNDLLALERGEFCEPEKNAAPIPRIPQPGTNTPPTYDKPPPPPNPPKPPLGRLLVDHPIGRHSICVGCKSSVIARRAYGPMRCVHPECEYHDKPQPDNT